MSKGNRYKNDSKKGKSSVGRLSERYNSFINDRRNRTIAGLTLLLVSVYLFIAFSSYLFTWEEDQDKIFQFSWQLLLNEEVSIENTLGRLGAIISHQFFYNWFGIVSFSFVFVFFSTSLKLLFIQAKYSVLKIYKYTFLLIAWLAPLLAFIFSSSAFAWGGGYGKAVSEWMTAFIGPIGVGSFFLFSLIVFLVSINFPFQSLLLRKKQEESLVTDNTEDNGIIESEQKADLQEALNISDAPESEITLDMDSADEEPIQEGLSAEEEGMYLKIKEEKKPKKNTEEPDFNIEETIEEEIIGKGEVSNNYDPTLDLSSYKYPTLELLEDYGDDKIHINKEELEKNKDQIVQTLNNYNIKISRIKATVGPTVTLYEIVPAPGIRISKIKNLEDDIALSLSALGIRIIAPIPGKGAIGIEVPNVNKEVVPMKTMLGSEKFQKSEMELPIALGKTISNEIFITDLAKMPHLLMAGATGQGKSVGLNAMLVSLLYKRHPSQLKFVLVDPKKVELSLFKTIEKHFLAKLPGEEEAIITDTKKVINTLNALCIEMDDRYNLLKEARVRNIKEYNEKFVNRKLNPEKGHKFMPFIVLVVDEFADLIMTAGKEVESPIARLAQLARAIGIHLVIATQRPSVNIITGTIKANFPARIAFKVTSKIDSRTILDSGGAEQLIGRGDMLFAMGSDIIRLQCPFVDTDEVERITEFIGDQKGYPEAFLLPEYVGDESGGQGPGSLDEKDEFFEDAARVIVETQQGSTSMIQRRLKLGYNRAGRIMDQLEAIGIVGPARGSKPRDVLVHDIYQLEQFLQDKGGESGKNEFN